MSSAKEISLPVMSPNHCSVDLFQSARQSQLSDRLGVARHQTDSGKEVVEIVYEENDISVGAFENGIHVCEVPRETAEETCDFRWVTFGDLTVICYSPEVL